MGVQLVGLLLDNTGQVKDVSLEVSAERLSWSAAAAFRAASIRAEVWDRAASAAARSLAMVSRTLWNWAAVLAVMALMRLLAYSRNFLSWAAAWAASLERPFWASSDTLAIFLSKRSMALSRSLRAFLAFSLI